MKNEPFSYSETSGMSKAEFDEAIQGLLEKGLVHEVVVDGEIEYQLTDMGTSVGHHLESDPNKRN
jgi:hypothetical protein